MAKNDLSKNLSSVTDVMKDYMQAKLDLFKLDLLKRSTRTGVFLFTFFAMLFSFFSVAIFLMFSFSFWYGERTGSLSQGFLISAAVFLLLLIVIYLLRKVVFGRCIMKHISNILFSDDDD